MSNSFFKRQLLAAGITLTHLLLAPLLVMSQLVARPVVRLPYQLRESSGLVAIEPNTIWSHNDSGNTNQLFRIDTLGNILRTITVENVQNIDWEDLTRDSQGNFFINDAGNNDNNRQNLAIHILSNPQLNPSVSQQAQSIHFQLPDQTAFPPAVSNRNFDIEAIVWRNDSLMLFSKNRSSPTSGYCKLYALKASPGQQTAVLKDSVFTGLSVNDRVTGAALHPNGQMLVLLTRAGLHAFDQFEGNMFFRGRKTFLPFHTLPGQAEGISFVDNQTLLISEEGNSNQGGLLYEIRLSSFLSAGIFKEAAKSCKIVDQTLIIDSPVDYGTYVIILDQLGRPVERLNYTHHTRLPQLRPGVYHVYLVSKQQQNSCRIIVQNTRQ